jgi:hypothetical protein
LNSIHILCWQNTYFWKRSILPHVINCLCIYLSLLLEVFFLSVSILWNRMWDLSLDVAKSLVFRGSPGDLVWVWAFLQPHMILLASKAWLLWMIFSLRNAFQLRETLTLRLSSSEYMIFSRQNRAYSLLIVREDIIHCWGMTSVFIIKHFWSV